MGRCEFLSDAVCKAVKRKKYIIGFNRRTGERVRALTYTEAMQQAVAAMQVDPGKRNVLIAHQNVTNSGVNRRSDSETISIGGLDNIDRTVFDIFDYVALGHLHSPL